MATIDDDAPVRRQRRPSHPGTVLRTLFMEPRGIGVADLATTIGVSTKHLSQIVNGHVRLSPEIAARLGRVFGNGAAVWLRMQAAVDAWDGEAAIRDWVPPQVYASA